MSNILHVHEVKDAAYAAREWPHMVEPWAVENIKKALGNVIEHMVQEGSSSEDALPLPPYAVSRVRSAIRHINDVDRRCTRDIERHKPKKGRFG